MHKRSSIILIIFLLAYPISVFSQERKRLGYVPGELLVKFRPAVSRHLARATHRYFGSRAIKRFRRINVDHIKIPEGWSVEEALEIYQDDPDVEYAEPNYYRYATDTPNDTDFENLWGLHNTGQSVNGTSGTADADIDAPEAWDTQKECSSVAIAVLDTGADLDHQDLSDNIWSNSDEIPPDDGSDDDGNGYEDDIQGWDFVNGDNDPDDDNSQDEIYHGTHVSGTIGAKGNNNVGITGVCWSASIMPLKMLDADGEGDIMDEIEAIYYAIDNGAKIINASFGGSSYSLLEYQAIESARDAGLLFVAAAGNDGTDNDSYPVYPASYDLDNIISVAATDYDDNLPWWSNYGSTSVDVAAPGVDIYSTKADDDTYHYLSGTSMAAPHVSGLAALIWSADGSLTYTQVKDRILNGVDVIAALTGEVLMSGRINANNSINTPASGPAPPSQLAVGTLSSSQIDLSWIDNSSNEFGFKIERKTGSGGTYSQIATVGADVVFYSDTDLAESTTYYYRVCAFNSADNSSYSNEANATTFPAAPSSLSVSAASWTQIDLSWTDNSSNESGFKIERKTVSGGTYSQITTVAANVASYSDTGLSGATTYYYRVRAYNSAGNSNYSSEANATTPSAPTGGDGRCLIATAAYGSLMEPHVKVLREFRARFLLTTSVGRSFLDLYYTYSPPVAGFIARHDTVRLVVRWSLLPMVGISWMALHFGLGVTLAVIVLILALMSATAVVSLRSMRFRYQA